MPTFFSDELIIKRRAANEIAASGYWHQQHSLAGDAHHAHRHRMKANALFAQAREAHAALDEERRAHDRERRVRHAESFSRWDPPCP
ncbi:MAG: hypothetical protein ACHREM_08965 [Polyangiales bacterium]